MLEYCFPLSRNSEFMDQFAICAGWVLKQKISASMVEFFRVSPMQTCGEFLGGFTSFLLDKKRGPELRKKSPLLFQHAGCLLWILIMVYRKSLDLYKWVVFHPLYNLPNQPGALCFIVHLAFLFWIPSRKFTLRIWKWMVGRWNFLLSPNISGT